MLNVPKQAFGFIIAQFAATILLSVLLLTFDWTAAYSGFTGGMIAASANAWFALKVFGRAQDDEPVKTLRVFYWGEINKILLTCALFVAAFVLIKPVNAAALLAVYFLVHMTPAVMNLFSREPNESN